MMSPCNETPHRDSLYCAVYTAQLAEIGSKLRKRSQRLQTANHSGIVTYA